MRIAYLIGCYPALNHRYILQELRLLRATGMTVRTCSIAEPDRPLAQLSAEELAEAEGTFYVKRRLALLPRRRLCLAP